MFTNTTYNRVFSIFICNFNFNLDSTCFDLHISKSSCIFKSSNESVHQTFEVIFSQQKKVYLRLLARDFTLRKMLVSVWNLPLRNLKEYTNDHRLTAWCKWFQKAVTDILRIPDNICDISKNYVSTKL